MTTCARGRTPELGPVAGLDLLHLQCHIGTDTVAWARRGGNVVGVDFSENALDVARALSRRCKVDIEWVEADVYETAVALGGRTFDIVYTGIGALGWLPDLDPWADVVASLVAPGGVLYVVELHPMWQALIEDGNAISQDAINARFTRWDDEDRVTYAAPGRPLAHLSSFERLHSVSDVLSLCCGPASSSSSSMSST